MQFKGDVGNYNHQPDKCTFSKLDKHKPAQCVVFFEVWPSRALFIIKLYNSLNHFISYIQWKCCIITWKYFFPATINYRYFLHYSHFSPLAGNFHHPCQFSRNSRLVPHFSLNSFDTENLIIQVEAIFTGMIIGRNCCCQKFWQKHISSHLFFYCGAG